jgi:uncharacterized Ntn-hydrolase superfamily protein
MGSIQPPDSGPARREQFMKRIVLAVIFFFAAESAAFATWSVVAVDRKTGTIVIASATCVPQDDFVAGFGAKGLMDIQAIVVPGKGIAAAQAAVDRTRHNQELIFREIQKGTPPTQIIALLKQDPVIETRQFGIVDLGGRAAGYSGAKNQGASVDVQGEVPGQGIFFSIQGNIIMSDEVVLAAAAAFQAASGSLTDRVMAAMEAADRKGGDKRCNCDTPPRVAAPCDAKTAHVAYMLRADRADASGASYNDGKYAMYLSVTDKDIQPNENANPVKTLRLRYEAWKARQRK